ncbi:MAG TPA: ABC transporter substrate-binding protein [Candidatus Dormibacteraeota bacterium]|nr:ABC transporter substrate-binding protein [Candidatus Dormibacteraeota bacterium]
MGARSTLSSGRITLAVLVAVVAAACGSTTPSATPRSYSGTLTFASFNPFTGPDASFGPEMAAGCIPAAKTINDAGGILGHQAQCITVDTRGDPADAVPAAQKMLATTQNLVGMNGPSSDEALATVPIINRAHVPMFGDTGQAAFDHNANDYFWRLTPPDDAAGVAMASYAYRKGYRRGAAVFGNDLSSQGNVPNLLSAFKKLGGQIVINQQLALDQSSYRTEVEALIAANPDVIFTEADPQTDAAYLSQLQQLHGLIPVIGTQPTVQPPWAQAVSGAIGKDNLTKIFAGAQPYAPSQGPAWDVYNTALLASSADVPQPSQWSQDPYTETDYDAIVMMALAMNMANTPDPAFYNQYVSQVVAPAAGAVEVHSYKEGVDAIKAAMKITYVGAGGPISLDKYHNSSGAFELVGYAADGSNPHLDVVSAADIAKLRA